MGIFGVITEYTEYASPVTRKVPSACCKGALLFNLSSFDSLSQRMYSLFDVRFGEDILGQSCKLCLRDVV